ncbi:MAG: hypothetical protein HOO67_02030 [Candidatus Peribacteraceae bacterium]|nr:hypothetical protein [Candidatus Peribacteraceae bacterium]
MNKQNSTEKLPDDVQRVVDQKVVELRELNGADGRLDFHRRALKICKLAEKSGSVADVATLIRDSLKETIDELASVQGGKPRRGRKGRVGITRITRGRKF